MGGHDNIPINAFATNRESMRDSFNSSMSRFKKKGTWLCSCDQTPTCTTAVLLCSLISTQLINQSAALFGVC